MSHIRVMIVDPQRAARDRVRRMVQDEPDIDVVGEASSGEAAVDAVDAHAPDCVVMALDLPGINGAQTADRMQYQRATLRIVLLTDRKAHIDASRPGRVGLRKSAGRRALLGLIRPDRARDPQLSPRESQVLDRIATGGTNKEIAAELQVSVETVKLHVKNLFAKLGVNDRAQAVATAVRRGILRLA